MKWRILIFIDLKLTRMKKKRFLPSVGFFYVTQILGKSLSNKNNRVFPILYYIRVIGDSLQLPKRLKWGCA